MSRDTTEHSTLYRKSASTGKILQWRTWTEGNNIHTEWGATGEKLQRTLDTIKSGKSLGRKNATTPVTQAQKDCLGLWNKKLKGGYVLTPEAAEADETADVITGGIWPMLAHRFDKYPDKVTWPAFVQPKLDGHRCIAIVKQGKCTLWARSRAPIAHLPHLVKAIEASCKAMKCTDITLDGELYIDPTVFGFGRLSSLIRSQKPKPEKAQVEYHLYDAPNEDTYDLRHTRLKSFMRCNASDKLKLVETTLVEDPEAMYELFDQYLKDGYEGAIIRNVKGIYESKGKSGRSDHLIKVKEFDDNEFNITGVIEGNGKLMGHGIFICETQDGHTFECKMSGKDRSEELQDYLSNPDKYIGRVITVQHQGYTDTAKPVPRFPVGLRFREDL
jgi:DNA ligase 1